MFKFLSFLKPSKSHASRVTMSRLRERIKHISDTHLFLCFFSPKNTSQKWLLFGYFLTVSDIFRTFALSIRRRKITL